MTNKIQDLIDEYINETGDASWRLDPKEGMGVIFHDENEYIHIRDLAYNSALGFFKVSQFPGQPREAEFVEPDQANFTTAIFEAHDGNEPYRMWAVIPDDHTDGFIIGEWESVKNLHVALTRLIETGHADEETNELDERLGHKWLSVSEAAERFDVPTDTVRYAAREGHIPMAEKQGRDWRFPQRKFLWWHAKKYTPRS